MHDFTDRYCVLVIPMWRSVPLCKHCGGADLRTPCPGPRAWRQIRDAVDAEMTTSRAYLPYVPPPPPFPQGSYEPSLTGVASVGCRMVHRDRVR